MHLSSLHISKVTICNTIALVHVGLCDKPAAHLKRHCLPRVVEFLVQHMQYYTTWTVTLTNSNFVIHFIAQRSRASNSCVTMVGFLLRNCIFYILFTKLMSSAHMDSVLSADGIIGSVLSSMKAKNIPNVAIYTGLQPSRVRLFSVITLWFVRVVILALLIQHPIQ